ncbi:MAG: hypothetical protein ABIY51_12815 [Ferruginibacter sp.]
MRYSKWIGIITGLIIIMACFMPWTYHADIHKNFTGFFSEQNMYGRPGIFLTILAVISIGLLLANRVWARRGHIFVSAILISYAIKTFILFTACYNAYCPERKAGIYLVLIASFIMLIIAVVPGGKINKQVSHKHS